MPTIVTSPSMAITWPASSTVGLGSDEVENGIRTSATAEFPDRRGGCVIAEYRVIGSHGAGQTELVFAEVYGDHCGWAERLENLDANMPEAADADHDGDGAGARAWAKTS